MHVPHRNDLDDRIADFIQCNTTSGNSDETHTRTHRSRVEVEVDTSYVIRWKFRLCYFHLRIQVHNVGAKLMCKIVCKYSV